MKITNIAIFDFCETLVNFQSADLFVEYVIKNTNIKRLKYFKLICFLFENMKLNVFLNLLFPNLNLKKKFLLFLLRGIHRDTVLKLAENFYENHIEKGINNEILNIFLNHKKNGDITIICSGGYDVYLHIFGRKYGFDHILSTKICFKNSYATGFIDGIDCMFENKIKFVKILINDYYANIKFKDIFVYSDSISDVPLLLFANKPFVVSKYKSQSWIKKYRFNEIIIN